MKIKKHGGLVRCSFLFIILIPVISFCQLPVKLFTPGMFTIAHFDSLKQTVGKHKKIPPKYEKQILIALGYFPELVSARIKFRFKNSASLFSSRPGVLSVFKRSRNRKYIITISDSSDEKLIPLQLKNLDFNTQIGILGHELSHAADFSRKHTFGLLRIALGNLSHKFLDRFEYNTDSICIAHGLGYQLLAWSSFVRSTMHYENWTGSVNINRGPMLREKYMNPNTIMKRMRASALYAHLF